MSSSNFLVVLITTLALFGLSLAWPPNECTYSEDCAHWKPKCINHQCREVDYLPPGAQCRKNWDCPEVRSLCVENKCKTNAMCKLTNIACNTTADCSQEYQCIHEFCGILLMSD